MIINIVLCSTLIISFITDIKNRRILNIITFPSIIFGFIYHTVVHGWEGFLFSGGGFLVGLSLLLIPYLLGGMGAGDVKLMAAIGSLKGTAFVLQSFFYIALIGGIIALALIIKKNGFLTTIKAFRLFPLLSSKTGSILIRQDHYSSITFPYGVPITLGTLCALFLGGF